MVVPIPSYNHGAFDPHVPIDEPDTPEPPPTEEDLELTSRAPGSELAVIDAARQRGTPAARSQRAAARADAASARGGGESTSSAAAASAPASANMPAAAARDSAASTSSAATAAAPATAATAPAEPPTDPMQATAADNGEASGESAALRDEDVTGSDLHRLRLMGPDAQSLGCGCVSTDTLQPLAHT